MIRYADGNEVRVGDLVIYDEEGEATVVGVFETPEDFEGEGLKEPHVVFLTQRHGEVAQALDRAWDETIVLIRRAETA
jgi:hypothetical protein